MKSHRPTGKLPQSEPEAFADLVRDPPVRGFLHLPVRPNKSAVVLTHGAGAHCQSKLLVELSNAFAAVGFLVLRVDLPFRQLRPHGPPSPGGAARDRDGLRRAIEVAREKVQGPVYLGGHSYGGRQATMLAAESPEFVDGLLLLSYPLHPPRKPEQLRTSHFPKLTAPAFFAHGTRDPFASIAEMKQALDMIPARHALMEVEGVGHELLGKKTGSELPTHLADEFQSFSKISRQAK
jgi:predicted alpha/beta-hydrolase family hydrolase